MHADILLICRFDNFNQWNADHTEHSGGRSVSRGASILYSEKAYMLSLRETGHFMLYPVQREAGKHETYFGWTHPDTALDGVKFFLDTEVRAS